MKRRRKEETASGTSGDDFSLSAVAGSELLVMPVLIHGCAEFYKPIF